MASDVQTLGSLFVLEVPGEVHSGFPLTTRVNLGSRQDAFFFFSFGEIGLPHRFTTQKHYSPLTSAGSSTPEATVK